MSDPHRPSRAFRLGRGQCALCEAPLATAFYCEKHRQQVNARVREHMRKKKGYVRRLYGAASYTYAPIR